MVSERMNLWNKNPFLFFYATMLLNQFIVMLHRVRYTDWIWAGCGSAVREWHCSMKRLIKCSENILLPERKDLLWYKYTFLNHFYKKKKFKKRSTNWSYCIICRLGGFKEETRIHTPGRKRKPKAIHHLISWINETDIYQAGIVSQHYKMYSCLFILICFILKNNCV